MSSKESVLIITNYFPPEGGAASNRMYSLALALHQNNFNVNVVCPLPNYPTGEVFNEFRGKLHQKENKKGISIDRLWLSPSKSDNKFIRLLSMISFSVSLSIYLLITSTPKKVIIQYSPVFVGFTGVFWSWLFNKKTILNVSDLWPLAGLEMGLLNKGSYYNILEKMEHFCYDKSQLILGQSKEILTHVTHYNSQRTTFLYRNYPDFTPVEILSGTAGRSSETIKIAYAGLIGVAQGLSTIFSNIEIPKHIEFHIYGDGPDLTHLENLKKKQLVFHGNIARESLHKELMKYDIAFVPLIKRIYGSVPSKIFEYSRLGLPLLYMGGGEGGDIVKNKGIGWVIDVGSHKDLQSFLNQLQTSDLNNYDKEKIRGIAVLEFDLKQQMMALVNQLKVL
jgi:glycosyltransferase involved in cell wall biosynthesis